MVQRSIPLAQRHRIPKALQNRQHFTEAPYTGVIQSFMRAAPLAPQPLQSPGIGPIIAATLSPPWVFDFKKVSALGAPKVRPRLGPWNPGAASKAAELM